MEKFDLNDEWQVYSGEDASLWEVPSEAKTYSLPFDALMSVERDFMVPLGHENSYTSAAVFYFYNFLPKIKSPHRVYLEIDGLCGRGDVTIGGEFVASIVSSARKVIDITPYYEANAVVCFRIASLPDTGRYVGCGIAGGVRLLVVKEKLFVAPHGVLMATEKSGGKDLITANVELVNDGDADIFPIVMVEVLNAKNKRVAKKVRKVKILAFSTRHFDFPLKLSKGFEWAKFDPYLYHAAVKIDERREEEERTSFGIVSHKIDSNNVYHYNGIPAKLKGVVLAQNNAVSGSASVAVLEQRRLSALAKIGYNAVKFVGCPTQTVLNVLDAYGMICVVDLFECLRIGSRSNDGHMHFNSEWESVVIESISALRNHPCVAAYGVAHNATESYNRGDGHALVKRIVEKIKALDSSRPIIVSAKELVPTQKEITQFEVVVPHKEGVEFENLAVSAARGKSVFEKLTQEYFNLGDIAGYQYLYPRFSFDKAKPILGMGDKGIQAADVFEEVDKNAHVMGAFLEYGSDFLGSAERVERIHGVEPVYYNTEGDLDAAFNIKPAASIKEILLGKKTICSISVQDPDAVNPDASDNSTALESLWNWPRHIGKPVKVVVHSAGEIVALFLDGKPVGRKLSGKFSNYTATFKTNFYPGRLEAVCFHKGAEQVRAVLESVTQPKAIKLECDKKNIAVGEYAAIEIIITDKDGRIVSYAARDIEVQIQESGELVALANADPTRGSPVTVSNIAVHDGRALALARGQKEGKMVVKVLSDGLLSSKISIKVK
ncbi:MAG: DUF4982 domain-containing protein [Firmicutes bacterium]|nr:DUF4982 domain-containing protein [Bacillota bacterium]